MKFKTELLEGVLLKRYKRFFADIEYNKEMITIHVPNTGSLKGVIDSSLKTPQKCWFSLHHDPTKKLKGTLEAIQTAEGVWVGVNTSYPNKIVTEAIALSLESKNIFLPHWTEFQFYKSEFKINAESRLDGVFVHQESDLTNAKAKKHFIEIKNTTFKKVVQQNKKTISQAQFPDAVTERGQKHILEMIKLMKEGHRCEFVFTVQRNDVESFAPCKELDPEYSLLLKKAFDLGLIITPLLVELNRHEIKLTNKVLPIFLD